MYLRQLNDYALVTVCVCQLFCRTEAMSEPLRPPKQDQTHKDIEELSDLHVVRTKTPLESTYTAVVVQ